MEPEILTGRPLSMMTSFDILLLLIQSNYIKTWLFCETENLSYINNYPIENGNFVNMDKGGCILCSAMLFLNIEVHVGVRTGRKNKEIFCLSWI